VIAVERLVAGDVAHEALALVENLGRDDQLAALRRGEAGGRRLTRRRLDAAKEIARIEEDRQKAIQDVMDSGVAKREKSEAQEKAERDAAAKIEAERKAKEAAEKKAARQPDKVKLLAYADAIESIALPCMKTSEGQSALDSFLDEHGAALKLFRSNAGGL
jgi:membrane protein involved in colicin uptake